MSAGEIMEGRLMEDGILISALLFENSAIQVFRLDGVKGNEIRIGREVCRILDGLNDVAGAELMFPGTSMNTQFMYEEISKCSPGISIFGGYPGGHKLNSPAQDLPVIRVDDSVLKGQASLLKRLTKLVYATMEELQKAHNRLEELNSRLTVMAETDYLTGLYNRGMIEERIRKALTETETTNRPVSLIMIDIDHFKTINDTFGHQAGDQALVNLGISLRSNIEGKRQAGV